MFVSTAIRGRSAPIERSDSSPSTTSHPSPTPALPPSCGTIPPMIHAGSWPGLLEDESDHRRGRRLAVGTADHDRRLRGDELREEVRPAHAFDAVEVRGRDDHLPPCRWRRLAADVDLDSLERAHEDRVAQVPAAHLRSERLRDVGVGGHAGAADPDEVELPAAERRLSGGQGR